LLGAAFGLAASPAAIADIMGFGDFSQFSINQADGASGPTVGPNTIRLTNQAEGESRSIFHRTRQPITEFQASFTYRASGTPTGEFGACFVIQNSGQGPQSVATPLASGIPTHFGYSDLWGTFANSVAISLEYGWLTNNSSSTGRYTHGFVGGGSNNTAPLNLFSGNPIDVSVTYNGTLLSVRQRDTVTNAVFDVGYLINIPQFVGRNDAYVGFTASTNRNTMTNQDFTNLQFRGVPEPSSLLLTATALAAFARRR